MRNRCHRNGTAKAPAGAASALQASLGPGRSGDLSRGSVFAPCCYSVAKSCLTLCDPWPAAHQAFLPFSIPWSLLQLPSIESVDAIQPSHPLSPPVAAPVLEALLYLLPFLIYLPPSLFLEITLVTFYLQCYYLAVLGLSCGMWASL